MGKAKIANNPSFMVILDQIAICTQTFFKNNQPKLITRGFTHCVLLKNTVDRKYLRRFRYLNLDFQSSQGSRTIFFLSIPKVLDFFREVCLLKGRLIFIEEDTVNSNANEQNCYIREMIIFCLSHYFTCNIFEMYT
jgi:hypothetical protein